MVQQASQSSPDVVVLLYESLLKAARGQQDDTSELSDLEQKIEKAYGPDGLGILTVAGVPKFVELRQRLLPLSQAFATLPEDVKALYADPTCKFNFGWSHGVEMLANGQPDKYKGSYYANPLVNVPTTDEALMKKYPAYCRPNIWPTEHVPEYEAAFMELGKLICEVGMLVTKVCDKYVARKNSSFPEGRLLESIQNSSCHKGRLLHYFPPQPAQSNGHTTIKGSADTSSTGQGSIDKEEDWCGWHTDHGSLTGLTSAMYMRGSEGVGNPDPQAGLYIRQRQGAEVVQAPIPADQIAFQMGEAMQVLSGGLLRATPHYVKAPRAAKTGGVSRETLAIFMQPRWDEVLNLPGGSLSQAKIGVGQWQPGITFGDFAEATINGFYSPKP